MQHIAILDFGSQYTHLIARRIRDLQVLAKIYPNDVKPRQLPKDVIGIILSGGPQSVYDKKSASVDAGIFKLGKPMLGLCYGHQLMAKKLGGDVREGQIKEYGRTDLRQTRPSALLQGVNKKTRVWMSHGDTVNQLPAGFTVIGSTSDCPIAAMADEKNNFYGLQFHPEAHHTQEGKKILSNFVFKICRARPNWKIDDILADVIAKIKKQVGHKKVFLLVSGGVDSSVCFALLEKALGKKNVYGLYVDTGFMRLHESDEIKKALAKAGFDNLHIHDACKTFYQRLRDITDPEEKRKIIGQTFLDVKDQATKKLKLNPDEWILGQGTIYPDTIETGGTRHADIIKTHHNRVDAIQKLMAKGLVIEPIADFYKDEVRQIGRLLGLPTEIVNRHPFPGPGLAIRILCAEKTSSLKPSPLPSPWKGEGLRSVLLPVRSVGVQGDNRTYARPLAIWGLPKQKNENDYWEKLDTLSSQITNSSKQINRVLLLLNPPIQKRLPDPAIRPGIRHGACRAGFSRPNKKICLTPIRIHLLQKIDYIIMAEIKKNKLYDKIWQFPVVLIPIGGNDKESIVLRPFNSRDTMTANFYRMNLIILNKIIKKILATGKISHIFYDITNKPPATMEWE